MARISLLVACVVVLTGLSVVAQDNGDPSGDANCANNPCLTTYHNNNSRNGLNPHESVLVANNFPANFGQSPASVQVDGMIYAQPLYMYGISWAGSATCAAGTLNMVYVATENNSVYAIKADSPYTICATLSLNNGDTAVPVTALPGGPCNNLTGSTTLWDSWDHRHACYRP